MSTRPLHLVLVTLALLATTPLARPADPDEDPLRDLRRELRSDDREKQIAAAERARRLGPKAKLLGRELCALALHPDGEVKLAALEAIEKVEPDVYPHAIALVNGGDVWAAGKAINDLGPKAAAATPLLLHHLNANLKQNHLEALNRKGGALFIEALGKCGGIDVDAVEWLFSRLRENNDRREAASRDREAMLVAVATMARTQEELREPAIEIIVGAATGRGGQVERLKLLAGMAPQSVKTLRGLKVHPDERVRKIAAELFDAAMADAGKD